MTIRTACLFVCMVCSLVARSQQRDTMRIIHTLDSLYRSLSKWVDTFYLADYIMPTDRDHSNYSVSGKETLLLKDLIDSGVEVTFTPEQVRQLFLPHEVHIISRKAFLEMKRAPLVLTRPERHVRNKQNRLLRRWIEDDMAIDKKYPSDSAHYNSEEYISKWKKYDERDSMLRANKYAQSADLKQVRNRKRLMIFAPFLRYKDHWMMVMYIYSGYYHELDTIFSIIQL